MKQKHILKWLGIALGAYLLYAVLTAILVPLPQKEATGKLWSQYEARLSTDASQERVRSIEDTDSALLWRLQLIESAEREVIFSTFDLRADGSGQDLMAALYGAAQRGVRVRVIVDGLNGFLHLQNSGVLRALAAEENVEVRFYDPIDLLRPWKLNYRLHDKYLIADGSKYILGGRNSNDLFLGSYQENQNIDRDVLVVSDGGEGSSVSQLLTYFESVWSQPENKTITGKTSDAAAARADECRSETARARFYHQLYRGNLTDDQLYQKITDALTVLRQGASRHDTQVSIRALPGRASRKQTAVCRSCPTCGVVTMTIHSAVASSGPSGRGTMPMILGMGSGFVMAAFAVCSCSTRIPSSAAGTAGFWSSSRHGHFISGSVVLCRALQKNKRYYYQKNHFISVSSMAYRMKRNGAGLASICILATMVLVMLSSTACLYFGKGGQRCARAIRATFPWSCAFTKDEVAAWMKQTSLIARGMIEPSSGRTVLTYRINDDTRSAWFSGFLTDNSSPAQEETTLMDYERAVDLTILPLEDYNSMMGESLTLEADEGVFCCPRMPCYYESGYPHRRADLPDQGQRGISAAWRGLARTSRRRSI